MPFSRADQSLPETPAEGFDGRVVAADRGLLEPRFPGDETAIGGPACADAAVVAGEGAAQCAIRAECKGRRRRKALRRHLAPDPNQLPGRAGHFGRELASPIAAFETSAVPV